MPLEQLLDPGPYYRDVLLGFETEPMGFPRIGKPTLQEIHDVSREEGTGILHSIRIPAPGQ
jgi:hypothetical protein